MFTKWVTPRSVIAATVAVSVFGVAAIGSIGAQSYFAAQADAREAMSVATAGAQHTEQNLEGILTKADQTIITAQAVLAGSEGKTLDSSARDALKASIDRATAQLDALTKNTASIDEQVQTAMHLFDEQILWPPIAQETADELRRSTSGLSTSLLSTLERLLEHSEAVSAAQATWQAEQDRLAAEAAAKAAAEAAAAEAARLAKPKSIPATSTLTPSGGATAPVAPPPPSTPAPVVPGFDSSAYIFSFIPSTQATIQWVPGLCNGYYVCGRTLVSGATGVTPVIQLDSNPDVLAVYGTDVGKYVLVHEAAHARQYWFYGNVANMITQSALFVPGYTGTASVEYMADCATIYRLGYGLGSATYPYTSGCTAAQYAEAARVW